MTRPFIALYRWRVEPEHDAAFRQEWRSVTLAMREAGALGSCLTTASDGTFAAIALWPSEDARAAAFAANSHIVMSVPATRLEELRLTVEDDLWIGSPFAQMVDR
ncbi:hypothetical protein [Novosphingopyxis sp.]|uniref:hypothetical protein n=1 Tax=Novosphingopyxis sp. TaxID=2709690 RepID=UPI003B5C0C11